MDDREKRYRQASANCLELAKTTKDETSRAVLLAMAQTWLERAGSLRFRGFEAILSVFNNDQFRKQ